VPTPRPDLFAPFGRRSTVIDGGKRAHCQPADGGWAGGHGVFSKAMRFRIAFAL